MAPQSLLFQAFMLDQDCLCGLLLRMSSYHKCCVSCLAKAQLLLLNWPFLHCTRNQEAANLDKTLTSMPDDVDCLFNSSCLTNLVESRVRGRLSCSQPPCQ